MSKYGNQQVEVDGLKFASGAEARRYQELRLLEAAGEISHLSMQVRFVLQPRFRDRSGSYRRPIVYLADFCYVEHDVQVAEDVKGCDKRTGKLVTRSQVFEIKYKMMLYLYPHIDFRIVEA